MVTYAAVVDPTFLADLTTRQMETIREARALCGRTEAEFSYARRLVQGRIDIVSAERMRRAQGHPPSDLATLVATLPNALSAGVSPRLGGGSRLLDDPVGELVDFDAEGLDTSLLDPTALSELPELSDERLGEVATQLDRLERALSDRRRVAQDAFDRLSAELVRRYRTGEASLDMI